MKENLNWNRFQPTLSSYASPIGTHQSRTSVVRQADCILRSLTLPCRRQLQNGPNLQGFPGRSGYPASLNNSTGQDGSRNQCSLPCLVQKRSDVIELHFNDEAEMLRVPAPWETRYCFPYECADADRVPVRGAYRAAHGRCCRPTQEGCSHR